MSVKIKDWVQKIGEQELPIFKYTALAVTQGAAKEETSAAQLAQVILRDSGLTSRILRVANSAMFNPGRSSVSTISRAILLLGFDRVRSASMSLAIIDSLLKNRSQVHVRKLMAKSFHGAALAQGMATRRGDGNGEEIHIAVLLSNLGEMAFWCVAEDTGEKILQMAADENISFQQAQKEVLGFTFDQLTLSLVEDWSIGDLLRSSIKTPNVKNSRVQDIVLGKELAEVAPRGWDDPETQQVIKKISSHIKLDEKVTSELIRKQSDELVQTIKEFGAGEIIAYLPVTDESKNIDEPEELSAEEFPEADPLLQLGILRDLGDALEASPSPNVILEIILEGINRGVGMDRCLFALLSRDKSMLVSKYSIGNDNENLSKHFGFPVKSKNIFQQILANGQAAWIKDVRSAEYKELFTEQIRKVLKTETCLIYPVVINGKPIGLIYADRQPSKRAIEAELFSSFCHFGQQACMAIEHISRRKTS